MEEKYKTKKNKATNNRQFYLKVTSNLDKNIPILSQTYLTEALLTLFRESPK